MSKKKIMVALSGGVDSSVAAALLLEQGYDVSAAYMKNWINEDDILGDCPWQQDVEDATAVAETLGIPFEVVNLMDAYKSRIVDYLLKGYEEGITPNPDVMCNREIKFGVFREWALGKGFDTVATGHYARSRVNASGKREILMGLDPNKDQTYFLAMMKPDQVQAARFPIGDLLKPDVRAVAERFGLSTATKKDSQGICFIGQIKMSDFLSAYLPDEPGNIVSQDGKVLGTHRGLHFYTLGQRKGIGVASNTYKKSYVVVEKRKETRELVIAFDERDTPHLYSTSCEIRELSFTGEPIVEACEIQARPRYRAQSEAITYTPLAEGVARIEWHQPQRAIAKGQICALYDGEVLLGGGIYTEIWD
ncbi:tRNA 2-thiouridine(34) synthase MnmA [Kiritimatiellota bacterium B12222]|nr:tRNA 2-thiouridine(34) synthase MnmA [Kiritimatiellota bacterium B12222]